MTTKATQLSAAVWLAEVRDRFVEFDSTEWTIDQLNIVRRLSDEAVRRCYVEEWARTNKLPIPVYKSREWCDLYQQWLDAN